MTQLDLPQVSVQRYVDLLKRRRWQVIPVSLLGLMIGGIVAFFIPRYYVADGTITWSSSDVVGSPKEDPFAQIVNDAQLRIPTAIKKTITDLGWEEASIADPYELGKRLDLIESNLTIKDQNAKQGRTYAQIQIVFRDRDGLRSAAFVNRLMETWIAQELATKKAAAEEAKARTTALANQLSTAYDRYLDQKAQLENSFGINPQFDLVLQSSEYKARREAAEARKADLAKRREEIVGLQELLRQLEDKLKLIPQRKAIDITQLAETLQKNPDALKLSLEIKYTEQVLEGYAATNPGRPVVMAQLSKLKADLAKMLGEGGASGDGTVPNPDYQDALKLVDAAALDLSTKQKVLQGLAAQVADEDAALPRFVEGFKEYSKLLQKIAETSASMAQQQKEVEAANAQLGMLNRTPPVRIERRADTPPTPTDPNIMVVALIGCVLGLAIATGLILLLDMLQGSYKTIEDVERGLAVPVLGGVSHLETSAERSASVRKRRRVTLVSAAFVVMICGVVLLYYWDKTRLPAFVRDLLALVLPPA